MKKILFLLLFVFADCCPYVDDLDDALRQDLYSQRPDLFLRKKFFNDVEKCSSVNDGKRFVFKGINSGCSFGLYVLVGLVCNQIFNLNFELDRRFSERFFEEIPRRVGDMRFGRRFRPINTNQWTTLKIVAALFGFGCGWGAATLFYKSFNKLIDMIAPEKNYEAGSYKVLREFLSNWEKYKVCTPKELHVFFDKLSDYYEENCLAGATNPYTADIDQYWAEIEGGEVPEGESFCRLRGHAYEIVQYIRAILDGGQPVEIIPEELVPKS